MDSTTTIGVESTESSTTTEPSAEDAADEGDDLEIGFVVGDEEFDTKAEAEEYIVQQKLDQVLDQSRERLCDVMGDGADEHLVETVSPEGETLSFEEVAKHLLEPSEVVTDIADAEPRVVVGAMLNTFGKQYANNNFKFA